MLKVSRLLATGLEILVANAKFSVALATSWSQFRTLLLVLVFALFIQSKLSFMPVYPDNNSGLAFFNVPVKLFTVLARVARSMVSANQR